MPVTRPLGSRSKNKIPAIFESDILVVGKDEDVRNRHSFVLTVNDTKYYGNAIVIRVLKSGNLQKLKITKFPIKKITIIINFE